MAELGSLFQNLGPTGGALMSGLTTGQDMVSAAQQDDLRKAQMEEILQRTAAQKEIAPLELQAKQQAIASADLKAKQERLAYQAQLLSDAIPRLKATSGPGRFAQMEQIFAEAGMPMDEADRRHMYSTTPEAFLKDLEARHAWAITQNPQYRREMDKQLLHNQGQMDVERERSKSRADIASMKAAKTASTIDDQAKSGKLTYEKAAVAFSIMAMNADTVEDQQKYQQKAAQYEQLAAKLRAAGNTGKVDVGAASNLPTTGYEPVLAPGATPPANPNSPKVSLPPGWSVK